MNFKNIQTMSFLLLLLCNWVFGQLSYSEFRNLKNEDSFAPKRNFLNSENWTFQGENSSKNYFNTVNTSNFNILNDEGVTANVALNLDYQPENYMAPWIIYIFNESGYLNFAFYEGSNQMIVNLPLGEYEFFAEFKDTSNRSVFVVKENFAVEENITIDFTPSHSTNLITFDILDQDGNELNPGVHYPSNNIYSQIIFERFFNFAPTNQGLGLTSFMTDNPWGENAPFWDFYINDVSDRYEAFHSVIGTKFDDLNYFVIFDKMNQFSTSQNIQNSFAELNYHEQQFQPTNLGQNTEKYYGFSTSTSLTEDLLIGGWQMTNSTIINSNNPFKSYITNYQNNEGLGMMVFPHMAEYVTILDPNYGPEPFSIKGTSVFPNTDGQIIYGTDHLGYSQIGLGNKYYVDAIGYVHGLPHHPKFSFLKEHNLNFSYGKTVPIIVSGAFLSENISHQHLKVNFKGLHNENRESDLFASTVKILKDNVEVFDGTYYDFISQNLPNTGQIQILFSNENTPINGGIGKNLTEITYDAASGNEPPTLQMLQFRNGNEIVTNQFLANDDPVVRIAAGDFDYVANDDWSGEFQYVDGNNVELFYSKHAQDTWSEIELTENPDFFQLPAFGKYYEASLSGINEQESDVWYDVKVVCTDAVGNKQIQTLSPAFQLNSTLQTIDLANADDVIVYPNPISDYLYFTVPNSIQSTYILTLTDLSGKQIFAQNRKQKDLKKLDVSFLPKGIYVFSIEADGKLISKKVIKK